MFENRFFSFAATGYSLYVGILIAFIASKVAGIHEIAWIFPVVLAFILLGSSLLVRRSGAGWNEVMKRLAFFVLLLVFSGVLATMFYDMSFDGRWYHQEGIIRLKEGFDPLREQVNMSALPAGILSLDGCGVWINHYPKASEITAASVYAFSGDIEVAKLFNFLLSFCAVSVIFGLLHRASPGQRLLNVLLAMAMVANPIVISQFWTFYVDAQLYILMLGMAGFLLFHATGGSRIPLLFAGMVAIGLVNTKFTGLIYAVAIVLAYCGYTLFRTGSGRMFRSTGIILSIALFVGCIVVGYNPYVRNVLEHGHPFHPIMGRNRIDIVGTNAPLEFVRLGRVEKLLLSNWTNSSCGFNLVQGRLPAKIPFTFHVREFSETAMWDTRIGGFGPFYGGLLLCGLLAWIWGAVRRLRGSGSFRKGLANLGGIDAALLFCLATALVIPESWWARYVPQLWVVPFLCWLSIPRVGGSRPFVSMGLAASAGIALFGALGILISCIVQNARWTLILERDFLRLDRAHVPLQVYFGSQTADRLKFSVLSIPIRPVALPAALVGRYTFDLHYGGTIGFDDEVLDRNLRTKGGGRELLAPYFRDRFVAPVKLLLHLQDGR